MHLVGADLSISLWKMYSLFCILLKHWDKDVMDKGDNSLNVHENNKYLFQSENDLVDL